MHNYNNYLPVIAAALTVLIFGCLNLGFTKRQDSACSDECKTSDCCITPDGYPCYIRLSLLALIVGCLVLVLQHQK